MLTYLCNKAPVIQKFNSPLSASTQNFPATANCKFPVVFHNLLSAAHNHFSPLWSYFLLAQSVVQAKEHFALLPVLLAQLPQLMQHDGSF